MAETELIHFMPKTWPKPPRQRRIKFDKEYLLRLAANMAANGIQNPLVCLEDGEIISGDCRWSASLLVDSIDTVPVRIVTDPLTAKDIRVRRISENLHRQDVTSYERCLEIEGFRADEPKISAKEMAELLNVDPSMITRYLSLADCIDDVRQALKDERIGIKAVYEISKAPKEAQKALLDAALASGAEGVATARKKRTGTVPAVRVSRCKFARPSGNVVTLSGGELSLEEAATELSELAAEMRKADKNGISIKTFMANCRDKAEAGV